MKFKDFLNEKVDYKKVYNEFEDALPDSFFNNINSYKVNGKLDYESIISDYWNDFVNVYGRVFIKMAGKKLEEKNKSDITSIIKEFKKNKIIVKIADNDVLVGRIDSIEDVKKVMNKFDIIYNVRKGEKDTELVYIELNGVISESVSSDLKKIYKELESENDSKGRLILQLYVDYGEEMPEVFEYELNDVTPKEAVNKLKKTKVFKNALGFMDDGEFTETIPLGDIDDIDYEFEEN